MQPNLSILAILDACLLQPDKGPLPRHTGTPFAIHLFAYSIYVCANPFLATFHMCTHISQMNDGFKLEIAVTICLVWAVINSFYVFGLVGD